MRITTWNINSVRLRLPLIEKLVHEQKPDVLCLQEIKCEDAHFPAAALQALGFIHQHIHGMKSYNGVAILSRLPLAQPRLYHRAGREDCRHISASINGVEIHNLYIPAGGDIPDPALNDKFAHKLNFLDDLTAWGQKLDAQPRLLVGDFNIAPFEHDVWSHKQLLDVVSHTPVEVARLAALQQTHDWVDVARAFVPPAEKLYSWWSYRNNDWRKSDRGRRLDHIWAAPALAGRIKDFAILKDARDWTAPNQATPDKPILPSDHVPVSVVVG